jgi:AAA family ATP:ADP antiporter
MSQSVPAQVEISRKDEWRAAALAFTWFLMTLFGYNILRPIRETLFTELSTAEKSNLFLATFAVMLVIAPIYSALATKLSRTMLLNVVIHFLALNVLVFAAWKQFVPAQGLWLSRIFFIWVSVFSLLVTSVFWSVLTDIFSNEQSKRLFGPIATGGTIGAITGAGSIALFLAKLPMSVQLFLVFVLLEIGLILAGALLFRVRNWNRAPRLERATEGGVFAGFSEIGRSPYLMLIAIYLAMIAFCGTSNYMRLTGAVRTEIPVEAERTQFYATLNFWAQLLTLVAQSLLVGPMMKRFGLAFTLSILPLVYFFSFASLMFLEGAVILGIIDVATRTSAYGLTVPAREVLFTVVSRDAKYKSKNFIDTVVFRGFDAIASLLRVAIPIALAVSLCWMGIAWVLGKMQNRRAQSGDSLSEASAT